MTLFRLIRCWPFAALNNNCEINQYGHTHAPITRLQCGTHLLSTCNNSKPTNIVCFNLPTHFVSFLPRTYDKLWLKTNPSTYSFNEAVYNNKCSLRFLFPIVRVCHNCFWLCSRQLVRVFGYIRYFFPFVDARI